MVCSPTTRASVCPRHKLWSTACSTGSGRTISPSRRPFYLSTAKAAGKTGRQASEACIARHELKLSRTSLSLALINLSPINISGRCPALLFLSSLGTRPGGAWINPQTRAADTRKKSHIQLQLASAAMSGTRASAEPEVPHPLRRHCIALHLIANRGVGLILEINGQMRAAI